MKAHSTLPLSLRLWGFFILSLSSMGMYAQDCGEFRLFNFSDTTFMDWHINQMRPGFHFEMTYDTLWAPNTGYISFTFISLDGDTLTDPKYYEWSRFFPFQTGDTLDYLMAFDSGYEALPPSFEGHLVTRNPECQIPIAFGTVDIQPLDPEPEIVLFPNPCKDWFTLQNTSPLQYFRLIDATGREVLKHTGRSNTDVSTLPSGTYTLSAQWESGRLSHHKLLKID